MDYVMHPCSFSNGGTINLILTLTLTLYTGISSGPNARYRVWEAFTFYLFISLPITDLSRIVSSSEIKKKHSCMTRVTFNSP